MNVQLGDFVKVLNLDPPEYGTVSAIDQDTVPEKLTVVIVDKQTGNLSKIMTYADEVEIFF